MSLGWSEPGLLASTSGYRHAASRFGEAETIEAYLAFEAALAEVEGGLGIIPETAAGQIAAVCRPEYLDMDRLREEAALVGYPIVPLVAMLSRAAGVHGEWVHFGATTQDVMDTGQAIQLQRALKPVFAEFLTLERALAGLCARHRDTMMPGRSKLQHAVPIPFGYKVAVWLDQIHRRKMALRAAANAAGCVQFGGAAGTLAALSERGADVRTGLARRLNLYEPDITWHTSRDRMADLTFAATAALAALARMAMDVIHMMSTEVGELLEPPGDNRGSSSTMPQKRNPVLCEAIVEAARDVRGAPARVLDAMLQEHERATGHGYGERAALAHACTHLAGAVSLASDLITGLRVNTERMTQNLDMTGGLIHTEAVMMQLARPIGRLKAHDGLQELCRRVSEDSLDFADAVLMEYGIELPKAIIQNNAQCGSAFGMIDAVLEKVSADNASLLPL